MTSFSLFPGLTLQKSMRMLALTGLLILGFTPAAHAQNGAIEAALCGIVVMLTGNTGIMIATTGVAFLGIFALLGKLNWKLALTAAAAIAVLLGAPSIVDMIGGDGFCTEAAPPPAPDVADCANNMEQYGLSVGLVYCFRQDVTNATDAYITMFTDMLENYKWVVFTLAITLFGVKLLTLSVQDILKEGTVMIVKMAIALFIIFNAQALYDIETGAISEMIGWVQLGFQVATANGCTPPALPPGVNQDEYTVWQAYDCMFQTMFGTVTSPGAILTSMIMIIGIGLFSSTVGAMAGVLGIVAFVSVIMMLIRSLFTVLLSFLALGFFMIFTPLVAPLLVFDSKQTTQVFIKWVGFIFAAMIQPVFIIAYLSFAIMVMDEFIDGGQNLTGPCNEPAAQTAPTLPTGVTDPTTNAGAAPTPCSCNIGSSPATGAGVCSFKQLFNMANLGNIEETNSRSTSWKVPADPFEALVNANGGAAGGGAGANGNLQTTNGVPITTTNGQQFRTGMLTALKSNVIPTMHQFINFAGDFSIEGFTRLSDARMPSGTMLQLSTMLLAFTITVVILYQLAQEIPEMARRMAMMVGISLYSQARLPFEGFMNSGFQGAKAGIQNAPNGMGVSGLANTLGQGGSGMLAGFRNYIGM